PRAQGSQNPGDEHSRISGLTDDVVEPRDDSVTTLRRRGRELGYANEYALSESRLCAHSRCRHGHTIHPTQHDDDDLVLQHDVVRWPFRQLIHAEAPQLKRLTMCGFAARAIDDEHRALFAVAI